MSTEYKNLTPSEFLKGRYSLLKATQKNFSARYFSKKAGFSSPSYFSMIVSGKRKLTLASIDKIAKGLSLLESEKTWLVLNHNLKYVKGSRERQVLVQKIEQLGAKNSMSMESSHAKILSDPINVKIYLLAQSKHFKNRLTWMKKHFDSSLTIESLTSRVRQIIASGLWMRKGDSYVTCAPVIYSGDGCHSEYVRQFHSSIIQKARESLEGRQNEAIFGSRTFWVSRKRLPELEKRLNEIRKVIESEFEDTSGDTVINIQINAIKI